jgi:hypothetical protein
VRVELERARGREHRARAQRSPALHVRGRAALSARSVLRGSSGAGFRGTFTLLGEGFIPSINDSVGLGFGADWTRDTTWVPVVMQWNFFLTEHWSVFGEPGAALRLRDDFKDRGPDFTINGGGRYHFNDDVALTMRIGHPAFALGVSFLL